jgi:G:T-mismatch repair DNA endonuclease (very short patch repair protein)
MEKKGDVDVEIDVEKTNERIDKLKLDLLQIYPDKEIKSITKHVSIYSRILRYANEQNVSLSEFLENLGFKSMVQQKQTEPIEECLLRLYPNKIVEQIKLRDSNLYDRVRDNARKNKKNIKSFLLDLGFQYIHRKSRRKSDDLVLILKKLYPNNVVENLYRNNNYVYQKVHRAAIKENESIKGYLNMYGFMYKNVQKKTMSISEILIKMYPNRIVSDLAYHDNSFYKRVQKYASKNKMSIVEYLKTLGFDYRPKRKKELQNKVVN